MRSIAQFVSVVFHPLWMPLATYLIILSVDPFLFVQPAVFSFLLFILVINTIAPGISVVIMVKRKMLSSLEVEHRKERFAPFVLVTLYYVLAYVLIRVKGIHVPDEIFSLISGLIVSLLTALVISLKFKISVHVMAQGALVGVLIALSVRHQLGLHSVVSLAILLAALVAWARLRLGVHSTGEVYLGFVLGALLNFAFVYWGWFF